MKEKKTKKEEMLDTRRLRKHCVVLDANSRAILEAARADLKAKGNFRISYSQIIRYCLLKIYEQGNWEGLDHIF